MLYLNNNNNSNNNKNKYNEDEGYKMEISQKHIVKLCKRKI